MTKRDNKLRALDALTVYMIALIVSGTVGVLAYNLIGLWALYISRVLVTASPIVVAWRTRLKRTAWLKLEAPKILSTLGGSMVFAAFVLVAIPALLAVQIIAPDFAVSCFHITDALEGHSAKILHIILLVLITAVSETLLFEGYIYARLKSFSSPTSVSLIIAAAYALFQLDLYTMIPLFAIELGIIYVRRKTGSVMIPFVLHLISVTMTLAVKDYATDVSELLGVSMGALQVIGLGMIFLGAALPVAYIGVRVLGDLKKRSVIEKLILVGVSLTLIGAGYAVAHIV